MYTAKQTSLNTPAHHALILPSIHGCLGVIVMGRRYSGRKSSGSDSSADSNDGCACRPTQSPFPEGFFGLRYPGTDQLGIFLSRTGHAKVLPQNEWLASSEDKRTCNLHSNPHSNPKGTYHSSRHGHSVRCCAAVPKIVTFELESESPQSTSDRNAAWIWLQSGVTYPHGKSGAEWRGLIRKGV